LWERHPAAKIVAGSHSHRKANFVIDVGWHNTHSPAFYKAVKNTDFLIVHHPYYASGAAQGAGPEHESV
jgi:hypothetical protein